MQCEAVGCLDYGPKPSALAKVSLPQLALARAVAVAQTQTAAKLAAVHVAPHVVPAEAGQKHEKFQWRRRELKPLETAFLRQKALVHPHSVRRQTTSGGVVRS